jgi:imidazolonepropionase-like amidohydrolase
VETGCRCRVGVTSRRFSSVVGIDEAYDVAGWILPGLVDAHNHLSLASPSGDGAERHVSNILGKLEAKNRAQLAARMAAGDGRH